MTNAKPYFPYADPNEPLGWGSRITASSSTLMRQAPMTADEYLRSAIDCIDEKLGHGYAAKHPELIGAFITASAIDLGAAVIARAIESAADALDGTKHESVQLCNRSHDHRDGFSERADKLNATCDTLKVSTNRDGQHSEITSRR